MTMNVREFVGKIFFQADLSGIDATDKGLKEIQKTSERTAQGLIGLTTTVRNVGLGMTAFFTAPIVGLGYAAVNASADIEQLEINLGTLMQSTEKGHKMRLDLTQMAATTPLQTNDLVQASTTLLQYGYSAEKLLPTLRTLGDVALGDSTKFGRLTYAFGQIKAAGRLQGQDLLQLINAGFNPLQTISEKTGKSMAALKDEMTKGKISFDMVEQAFVDVTAEGGRFHDGMLRQSKSFRGMMSTYKDMLQLTLAEIGDRFLPTAKRALMFLAGDPNKKGSRGLLGFILDAVKGFMDLPAPIKWTTAVLVGLLAIMGPVVTTGAQMILMLVSLKANLVLAFGAEMAAKLFTFGFAFEKIAIALKTSAFFAARFILPLFVLWALFDDIFEWITGADGKQTLMGFLVGDFSKYKADLNSFLNDYLIPIRHAIEGITALIAGNPAAAMNNFTQNKEEYALLAKSFGGVAKMAWQADFPGLDWNKNNGAGNTIHVTVPVTVPAGTTKEQSTFLQNIVQTSTEAVFRSSLDNLLKSPNFSR